MPIRNNDSITNQPQDGLSLPWSINPAASWIDGQCWVEVLLDTGMVLHKILPQTTQQFDDLATTFYADNEPLAEDPDRPPDDTGGVNIQSNAKGNDVIQRMATSTYEFTLKGWGMRAGYQVPVPGLESVGGQTAIPDFPQWTSGNIIVANMMGIPVYYCAWEKKYMVLGPLKLGSIAPTPPNIAARIRADQSLPDTIGVPLAPTDNNSVVNTVQQALGGLLGAVGGGLGGFGGVLGGIKR
jgi:hypothetical protein